MRFDAIGHAYRNHVYTPATALSEFESRISERFMRSIKEECLERIIFFGEESLRNAVADFLAHYHQERNHQGLNNLLIQPGNDVGGITGDVACRERRGGMLWYYYKKQAT